MLRPPPPRRPTARQLDRSLATFCETSPRRLQPSTVFGRSHTLNMPPGVFRGNGGEPLEGWDDPIRGRVAWRTLFSGNVTATDRLTCGLAVLGPGGWLGLHRHAAAEVYHVIEGEGLVTLAGAEHPVTEGSAVSIPAEVEHGIRNSAPTVLRFFYASRRTRSTTSNTASRGIATGATERVSPRSATGPCTILDTPPSAGASRRRVARRLGDRAAA